MKKARKSVKLFQTLLNLLGRFWNNGIKPIFLVNIHDFRAIRKNFAAFVVVTGLCVLPSLYAWINIYACWDPYANTGNLPVAIVNNDEGAALGGKIVNVGDSIIENMKENKAMNWEFVDEWQGNYGLNEGKYYAMIEIPENFSSRLTSLSTSTPQKPVIIYRVNEKLNAIASKITNVAKEKLAANIKSNFVKTVNDQIIETFNNETSKSDRERMKISDLKAEIMTAKNDIIKMKEHIAKENTNSVEFQKYLDSTTVLLPKITEQVDSLGNVIQAGKSLNTQTINTKESITTDLNNDIMQLQSLNSQNQQLLAGLKDINSRTTDQDVIEIMKQTVDLLTNLHAIIEMDKNNVDKLNTDEKTKEKKYNSLTYLTASLDYTDKLVLEEKAKLKKLIPIMSEDPSKASIEAAINDLSKISDALSGKIQNVSSTYYSNTMPVLSKMANDTNIRLEDANNVLDSTKVIVPQLSALSGFLDATSRLTVEQRKELDHLLTNLQADVDQLYEKLDGISGEKFDHLLDTIENNPTEITDFLASPLEVKEQELYEVRTFGVGLTPFYTVLAIWVGSLLLSAMLAVECEDYVFGRKLNLVQKHFGKMILFLSLSLIQSTIITLGDVYILGVEPANFKLMMLFSVLSSITFTVMIFTMVSLLGNVGKAAAVVIMVFQIAGSGGIYPIQTNPEIFGKLLPLWPFTYAINGFREAIAGPVWSSVAVNINALLTFIAVFLALVILKKPLHALNMFFEHQFKKTEL